MIKNYQAESFENDKKWNKILFSFFKKIFLLHNNDMFIP